MHILNRRELLHVRVRSLQRTVDGVVGEVKEKRAVVISVDEVNRFARQRVGQIFMLDDRLASSQDGIVGIVGRLVVSHVG